MSFFKASRGFQPLVHAVWGHVPTEPLAGLWKDLGISPAQAAKFSADERKLCEKLFIGAGDHHAAAVGRAEQLEPPRINVFRSEANDITFVFRESDSYVDDEGNTQYVHLPPRLSDVEKLADAFKRAGMHVLAAQLLAAVVINDDDGSRQYSSHQRLKCAEKCIDLLGGTGQLEPMVAMRLAVYITDALDFSDVSQADRGLLESWRDTYVAALGKAKYDGAGHSHLNMYSDELLALRTGRQSRAKQRFEGQWIAARQALDGDTRKNNRRHEAAKHLGPLEDIIRKPGAARHIARTFAWKPDECKRVLKQAILEGHLDLVKFLVENAKLPRGFLDNSDTGHRRARNSLLCYAARLPSTDITKYLLSKGFTAKKIAKGANPLAEAVKAGHREMVKLLVEKGSPVSGTVVKAACALRDSTDAQWLIEAISPAQFDALAPDVQLDLFHVSMHCSLDNIQFIKNILERHGKCADFFLQRSRLNELEPWRAATYALDAANAEAGALFDALVPDEASLKNAIVQMCKTYGGRPTMAQALVESPLVRARFPNLDTLCRELVQESIKQGGGFVDHALTEVLKSDRVTLQPESKMIADDANALADAQRLIEAITPEQFDALPQHQQLDLLEMAFKSDLKSVRYSHLDFIQDALERHPGHAALLSLRVVTLDAWGRSLYAKYAADKDAAETFKMLAPNERALRDAIALLCWKHPGCDWMVKPLIESQIVRQTFPKVDAICREIASDPKSQEPRHDGQDTVAATLDAAFEDTPWVLDPGLVTDQVVSSVRDGRDPALAQRLIDCLDDPEGYRATKNLSASAHKDLCGLAIETGNGNYRMLWTMLKMNERDVSEVLDPEMLASGPFENVAAVAYSAAIGSEHTFYRYLVPNEATLKNVIRALCEDPSHDDGSLKTFLQSASVRGRYGREKVEDICAALRQEAVRDQNPRIAQLLTDAAFLAPLETPSAESNFSAHHDPLDRPVVPQNDQ